ncbi:MAG: HAMP domain-containing protein [Candidatus Staskawiczbacteria bacterium]|nr:HAMP domain-containing protein [Candidatus Staskawiczbacteria bacterium]
MAKHALKIAIPIILVGIFAIIIFIALNYETLEPSFYIIILFLVIFVFFFGFAIGQNLTSPLRRLLDKAIELSQGNLSSRVYLETEDELSELANIFNKIAQELQKTSEQEANMEKSVGIKVKARTQELEETINALEQKVKNRTIELERLLEESNKLQEAVKNKAEEKN